MSYERDPRTDEEFESDVRMSEVGPCPACGADPRPHDTRWSRGCCAEAAGPIGWPDAEVDDPIY